MQKNINKHVGAIIALALFYFITGKLGLSLAFVNESATAVWPPSGIAVASYILLGYRVWPAIFIGAFFTNVTTTGAIATSLGIALGNALEGLVAAYLINKFANGKNVFYRAQDIFKFIIFALISTTVSANIGTFTLILGSQILWRDFFPVWLTWWMGDATGILIFTPFIIFWRAHHPLQLFKGKKLEALILFIALLIIGGIVFGGFLSGNRSAYPLDFLVIPIVIWVAFRFGRRETITAIVVLSIIAIYGTIRGFGPFARQSPNESLVLLQSFMSITTITALSLAVSVSERRKVEESLANSEQRFKALIEKSTEAISLTDPNGMITYVTPSFTNVLGYSSEEIIGKSGFTIIHPDDKDYAAEVTSKIVGHPGKSVTVAIRCLHKDGSWRFVEITSTNLINNKSLQAVVSNFHDITELVKTEDRIMSEKSRAEALLNSIGDGIIATDQDGKIILANKVVEELLGWTEKDLTGKRSFDILLIEDEEKKVLSEKERPLTKALKTGKKIIATHYLVRKNGTKFPARVTATPIMQNGKIVGAIKVFHDITQEREVDEMKTEFISLASHELRTPLSAIKGFISMIKSGDYGQPPEKFERPLELVAQSTERLINIVNEMLDVSRIDAGRVQLTKGEFYLDELINEELSSIKPLFVQKNIKLVIKNMDHISINSDKEKIIEILNNLIGNALKFTEKGNITISSKQQEDHIIILVSDTGVGIEKKDQVKLFSKFEQLKSKRAGNVAGTGLGLYISREFARKLGGEIWLEKSEIGVGSIFAFSLPMSGQEQKKISKS